MAVARLPQAGHPISSKLGAGQQPTQCRDCMPLACPQVVQGTLIFDRDATLYRAIVGSIRSVRDYVEGRRGRVSCSPGGALHAVQSLPPARDSPACGNSLVMIIWERVNG